MRIKIILLLLILSFSLLVAQNVFIWDRDDGLEIQDPEDPWTYLGLEVAINNAMVANGIHPEIDSVLTGDLSQYDIIFATAGIWCDG